MRNVASDDYSCVQTNCHSNNAHCHVDNYCLLLFSNPLSLLSFSTLYSSPLHIQVWVHEGDSEDKNAYDLCAQLDNVPSLPSSGHFGVTAATGGLSGNNPVCIIMLYKSTCTR